ncbi:MAG: hypothetical protein SVR08_13880 [Spirochaetota bacterium]|nr:hypothetical protein [Spirochaetota bacterium]
MQYINFVYQFSRDHLFRVIVKQYNKGIGRFYISSSGSKISSSDDQGSLQR